MSATSTRMERPEAIAIARAFVAELEGTYEQLLIAGSLRRGLATIGDLEVVSVPRIGIEQRETGGLFGSEFSSYEVDRLHERIVGLLEDGTGVTAKRLDAKGSPRFGPTLKYLTYRGMNVDLFTPCAERFGLIVAIRTGPWQLSRWFVTKKSHGGALPNHLVVRDGWVHYRVSGQRIETPDEASFFALLGLDWIPPRERAAFAQKVLRRRR